jgi:hypothetical protein
MKIKINENKLNDIILKHIKSKFDVRNIHWIEMLDDDLHESEDAIKFYFGDFGDDDTIFRWYSQSYWDCYDNPYVDVELCVDYMKNSPMVVFEYSNDYDELKDMFGSLWEPIFIEWFKTNFNLPVKSVQK